MEQRPSRPVSGEQPAGVERLMVELVQVRTVAAELREAAAAEGGDEINLPHWDKFKD